MQFNRRQCYGHFLQSLVRTLVAATIVLAFVGCASGPTAVKMEPRSMAKKIGIPDCRVSVPLSQSEVVEDAKKVGNPNPEKNQEWITITENLRPGDQLRAVNCLSSRSTYFYALIRNNSIILKFYSSIFD